MQPLGACHQHGDDDRRSRHDSQGERPDRRERRPLCQIQRKISHTDRLVRLLPPTRKNSTVDKRSSDITSTDHSKSGKQNFSEACEQFIARMRVGENSRDRYLHSYRTYVRGAFGGRTLAQVAQDRDGVTSF
jgi:hypothetical protein